MYNLSGAIDVVLFLIIRPKLLLFPRPRQLDEQEDTGTAIFSDTAKFQHSPEPISATLGNEGSRDSRFSSRISDYI